MERRSSRDVSDDADSLDSLAESSIALARAAFFAPFLPPLARLLFFDMSRVLMLWRVPAISWAVLIPRRVARLMRGFDARLIRLKRLMVPTFVTRLYRPSSSSASPLACMICACARRVWRTRDGYATGAHRRWAYG